MLPQCGKKRECKFEAVINIYLSSCRTYNPKIVEQTLWTQNKRDLQLINLVSDFETKFEQGNIDYVEEKTIYQLIEYYESEFQIEKQWKS